MRRSPPAHPTRHHAGVTLLETLCVCLLLTIALVAVAPSFTRLTDPEDAMQRVLANLANLDHLARLNARAHGTTRLIYHPASHAFRVEQNHTTTSQANTTIAARPVGQPVAVRFENTRGDPLPAVTYSVAGADDDLVLQLTHRTGAQRRWVISAATGWVSEWNSPGATPGNHDSD